jgi:hypothetical protein
VTATVNFILRIVPATCVIMPDSYSVPEWALGDSNPGPLACPYLLFQFVDVRRRPYLVAIFGFQLAGVRVQLYATAGVKGSAHVNCAKVCYFLLGYVSGQLSRSSYSKVGAYSVIRRALPALEVRATHSVSGRAVTYRSTSSLFAEGGCAIQVVKRSSTAIEISSESKLLFPAQGIPRDSQVMFMQSQKLPLVHA